MKIVILISMLFLFNECGQDQQTTHTSTEQDVEIEEKNTDQFIDIEDTKQLVTDIASDEFEGRFTGSEGYNKAADYVVNYLQEAGFQPVFNTFFDEGVFSDITSHNVVGINKDYDASKQTIVLSAHLDHLKVQATGEDRIMNGANDNASGVTAALQIGKYLATQNHDENIIVALFTAEEIGLQGSRQLAKRMKAERIIPDVVYNFEMVGNELTNQPGNVYLTGYDKSNMAKELNTALEFEFATFLQRSKEFNLFARSDNFPFYDEFEIPAHSLSSFDFDNSPHYHKVTDEVTELEIGNMNLIINNAAKAINQLLKNDIEIKLVEK